MKKILLVGQTPPPYGGQAMMIQRTLNGNFGKEIKLFHIRMSFSSEMDEIGKFRFRKILHLFNIIILTYYNRFKNQTKILYYFPSGPNSIPFARDILYLSLTKFLFDKIIFHFRAAGISEYIQKSNIIIRYFAKIVYKHDIGIKLSKFNPDDTKYFNAKKEFIIPNGIEDKFLEYAFTSKNYERKISLLYIGVIKRTKGIIELLDATSLLIKRKNDIILNVVGKFESKEFEEEVNIFIKKNNITNRVIFHGVKVEREKYEIIYNSDIFVFPTYFESESFGNVIIEAMSFGKPIVATHWRGVQEIVRENENGFLVPIKDSKSLSEKIEILIKNEQLRNNFGRKSRALFINYYTLNKFIDNMKYVFEAI